MTVLRKMWFISLIFFRIKIHETGLMADSSVETQRKLLGLVTFIGTLSLTFWWAGVSIYPIETLASAVGFMTIVLVALLLRAMAGTSLAFTVRSISVPIGLYIAAVTGSGIRRRLWFYWYFPIAYNFRTLVSILYACPRWRKHVCKE